MKEVLKIEPAEEKKTSTTREPISFMAVHSDDYLNLSNEAIWVADSGTTHHMTGREELLTDYSGFDEPRRILTADGEALSTGKGKYYFVGHNKELAYLDEVWLVPSLKTNLFSVEAATKNGFDVTFNSVGKSIKILAA